MAKVNLKDTVPDSEIIRLGEITSEPKYKFPDGKFGITGKYKDYSLVEKRIAYRTGKENDGANCGKVIEYETWEDYPCYVSTLEGIFKSYASILNLTEFKAMKVNSSIGELVAIHKSTHDKINKALCGLDNFVTDTKEEICNLADTKQKLLVEINELKAIKSNMSNMIASIDKMYAEIKEKRKIIVDVDKPKKHRMKLED